jgi:hypothetical protein
LRRFIVELLFQKPLQTFRITAGAVDAGFGAGASREAVADLVRAALNDLTRRRILQKVTDGMYGINDEEAASRLLTGEAAPRAKSEDVDVNKLREEIIDATLVALKDGPLAFKDLCDKVVSADLPQTEQKTRRMRLSGYIVGLQTQGKVVRKGLHWALSSGQPQRPQTPSPPPVPVAGLSRKRRSRDERERVVKVARKLPVAEKRDGDALEAVIADVLKAFGELTFGQLCEKVAERKGSGYSAGLCEKVLTALKDHSFTTFEWRLESSLHGRHIIYNVFYGLIDG